MNDPYQPGDVIVMEGYGIITKHYVVADPSHTSHGKLRLIRVKEGTIRTTWWRPGEPLPRHHRRLPRGF